MDKYESWFLTYTPTPFEDILTPRHRVELKSKTEQEALEEAGEKMEEITKSAYAFRPRVIHEVTYHLT